MIVNAATADNVQMGIVLGNVLRKRDIVTPASYAGHTAVYAVSHTRNGVAAYHAIKAFMYERRRMYLYIHWFT